LKIVIHGCSIEQIGKHLVWEQLQKLVPEHRIEIVSIVKGSVIITVKSSIDGINEIYTLYQSGKFDRILGFPIQRLELHQHPDRQQGKLFGYDRIQPISNWVGREELLTELYAQLQDKRRVIVLWGQGGIGKTSLAVKLMAACGVDGSQLLPKSCSYDNALFYSVNESDSFDSLVAKFFKALGLATTSDGATAAQIIESIVQRLHQERWLVVLDNLESLMELGTAKSKSADVGDLLYSLSYGGHDSQIVITSRKFPDDLNDRRGNSPHPSIVYARRVEGISDEASIELLQALGMRDIQADLGWIAGRVGGNIFILEQLASYARNKPRILRKQPHLVTKEAKPIVRAQWELQGSPAQDLLQRMCVLQIGMDAAALTTLRLLQPDGEAMAFTPEAEATTEDLLTGLVKSDLLQDRYDESVCESRYRLHPLMAETLQEIFKADLDRLWRYAARLYGSIDRPPEYRSLEDLQFLLEEAHFHWKSRSIENIGHLMSIVVNKILPKLNKWCYWDLEELWLEHILTIETELGDPVGMASSCGGLGIIAFKRGDYDKAETLYTQSLAIYTELDDRAGMANVWGCLGNIASKRCDYDKAEVLYNQSLEVLTETGDRATMATIWGCLGDIASRRGNYDKAVALYNQSLAIYTELDNRAGMATSIGCLGDIARLWRDYDKAESLYNQALTVRTELGDRAGIATIWGLLGNIASRRGNYDKAEALYDRSLSVQTELGNQAGMATSIGSLGENELDRGDLNKAEPLLLDALDQLKALQLPDFIAETSCLLARLYRAKGELDKAQEYFDRAHELYTQLGAKADSARIERAWNESV
jgi:tetratricopeptide (TPR) repeat protein